MKNSKKIFMVIKIVMLFWVLSILPVGHVYASSDDDFSYEKNSTGITVTDYSGSDKDVVIPSKIDGENVTRIGDYAFNSCFRLTDVTIPTKVKRIGDYAFYNDLALKRISLGKNVTSIGNYAFAYCFDLTRITIPAKVKKIGSYAFCECTSLAKVTIGKNVTSIGSKAFYKCTKLKSITIPSKVKMIGSSVFYGCKNLKKITLTAGNLKTISKNAFKGIYKNAAITVKGTKKAKAALKKKLMKRTIGYLSTWRIK